MVYILSVLILASTIFSPSISGAIVIVLLSFLGELQDGVGNRSDFNYIFHLAVLL